MKTNILKILVGITVSLSSILSYAIEADFSGWIPINRKTVKLKIENNTLISTAEKAKQTGIAASFKSVKLEANTVVRFEWKGESTGIDYTAFAFFTEDSKTPYFIWHNGKNAYKNPEKGVWQKVEILATELKNLKYKNLNAGSTLKRIRFWQKGQAPQKLSIKNFVITKAKAEKARFLQKVASVNIWPRRSTVCIPTRLEQFIFMEFPSVKTNQDLKIRLTLPAGISIKAYPAASYKDALPSRSIMPKKSVQNGNILDITVSAADASKFAPNAFWITLSADVQTAPGKHQLKTEIFDNNKLLSSKTFPVKIYPKLKPVKLKSLRSIVFSYNGLAKKFVPLYVNMMKEAGINEIHSMHGETHGEDSVSKYALQKNIKLGLIFFVHNVFKYAKQNDFFKKENIQWGLSWMLDNPAIFQKALKEYINHASAGINYSIINIDSEAASYRYGKIAGDLSPYGLKAFQKFAKIPLNTQLTSELIKEKYSKQWIKYRCHQSNKITENARELIDDNWPERQLMVYSGYEFNMAPYKDRTRKNYGVDWKTMADTGLDYGIAGYGGSMDQIQATAEALKGKAIFIPAEMALVNFYTKRRFRKSPEEWSMRLITTFLNSGMKGGLGIWYGNDLDGSALIAMNRAFDFMQKIEPFALKGKRADNVIRVYPSSEKENVYVLRKGGNTLIIAVNNNNTTKQIRIRLADFTLKGHTSDLEIKDLVSNEQIPVKKVLKVKIQPYSYRLISMIDDGN